jgi:hypothetical protein
LLNIEDFPKKSVFGKASIEALPVQGPAAAYSVLI